MNRAARKLYLSPQALSSAIAGLERELGFELFYRQRIGVTLTEEGLRVLEDSRSILTLTEHWKTLKRRDLTAADQSDVTINVNVSLALAASFNRFLIELEQSHPRLSVIVNEGRGKRLMDCLKQGYSGITICSLADEYYEELVSAKEEYGLQIYRLMDDEFAVVLGRDYFPQYQEKLSLEDCRKLCLILSSDKNDVISRRYVSLFGGCLQAKVESYSSILYMVEQNKGVVILPRRIICCEPMYTAGMLRILPVRGLHMHTRHYMVCSGTAAEQPEVHMLASLIQDYYTRAEWEN